MLLVDVIGFCSVLVMVGYLFYRLLVVEKNRDLARREAEIKRKDEEIDRLRNELDMRR